MDVGVQCLPFTDACDALVTVITTNNTQPLISTQPSDGATILIGVLAAALVVVVTGWIVTCVYLQRKINK